MRILIIHNFYQDAGGEDIVFQHEVRALSEKNEVETIQFKNKKGFPGLRQFFGSPWNISAAQQVRKKIKSFQPDIVHIHNTQYAAGPLLFRAISKAGIPQVMTVHNFRLLCPSASLFFKNHLFLDSITKKFPWKACLQGVLDYSIAKTIWVSLSYWMHRRLGTWNKIDRYFVLSEFSKNLFASSTFPVPTERFSVKSNFINPLKANLQNKDSQTFLYIGRLSEEKGIIPLLKALKGTSFYLKIAGTGPLSKEVKQLIHHEARISYLGQLSHAEIALELAQSTALIVPSVCYEGGFPLTAIEAFSIGVPVIASSIGVLKEQIIKDFTGDTFDIHTAESVQHTLHRWLEKPASEKEQIGRNCYSIFQSQYSKEANMNLLLQYYEEIISAKKKN